MAHECDDCGESFETLTRLRLHDCGDVQSETSPTSSDSNRSDPGYSSPTEERNASVAELDTLLDRFSDGDKDALHYAVVEFESALSAALEEDNSGDTYRDVFWPYHERVSDALDVTELSESDVYDIEETGYVPEAEIDEEQRETRLQGLKDRLATSDDPKPRNFARNWRAGSRS